MAENGISRAYENWRGSAEKFDYFMAGLSAAVLAYVAPTFQPARLGWNAESLELAAMFALLGSAFAAFKRIESTVHLQRVGVLRLGKAESAQRLSAAIRDGTTVTDEDTAEVLNAERVQALVENRKTLVDSAKELEQRIEKKAGRWYIARNYLLILGFLLLLASRIWKGYP